jgi:ADP-ribose pyrophosphatase
VKERTTNMKRLYEGRIVSLELHDVELEDGRQSMREVVRHGPAVAVIAELQDGHFVFVKQYRKPLERYMLEIVAGGVDPGEATDVAAARELREETGYRAEHLVRLGAVYPSPGYLDEHIEIYYARLQAEPVGEDFDDDEHIELVTMSHDAFVRAVRDGEITDAKTLSAWLLYKQWKAEA